MALFFLEKTLFFYKIIIYLSKRGVSMKKKILIGIVLMTMLLLTACTSDVLDTKSLLKAPKLSNKYIEIQKTLDNILRDYSLVTPQNGANKEAVYLLNLYGDSKEEAIIFVRDNESYEIKIVVLQREENESWLEKNVFSGIGFSINRVDFRDLDGDGNNELIIGWEGSTLIDRGISVYTIKNDQLLEVFNKNYTAYTLEDLDIDGNDELMIINLDKMKGEANAVLYDLDVDTKSMYYVDQVKMDGYVNSYYNVTSGYVSSTRKGVLIDVNIGAHASYTDLIIFHNGQLRNLFYNTKWEYTDLTFRPYSIKSRDIDEDGIMEIPLLRIPKGYEETPSIEVPYITAWMEWNGLYGLKFDKESYMNLNNNFIIFFPEEWRYNVTLTVEKDKYLFDYYSFVDKKSYSIFEIIVLDKAKYYENRGEYHDYRIIDTLINRMYLVKINKNIPENVKSIDFDYILNNFKHLN